MKSNFLVLQTNYNNVQIGLFEGQTLRDEISIEKFHASKFLMDRLVTLLQEHSLTWSDISFIGINQGPGPFTTLRAIITTVNGISFAQAIPLVGVDGLIALLKESQKETITIALLNAFNKDVYFGIKKNEQYVTGWQEGISFLNETAQKYNDQTVLFIGNAVPLFKETIETLFGADAISDKLTNTASLQAITNIAQEKWNQNKNSEKKLLPIYLKTGAYKVANPHL